MTRSQLHSILEKARGFAEEGKALHAIQLYRRVQEDEPSAVESYARLAILYSEQGHNNSAESVLGLGLKRDPTNPELLLLLGDLLVREGRYSSAISCYSRIRRFKRPGIHLRLGLAHFRAGDLVAAEHELRSAIRVDPSLPKVHELLGEILLRGGDAEHAIAELRRAIRRDRYSGTAHRLLGSALLDTQHVVEAHEEFLLAVDMNPDDPVAWQLCGETLIRMRQYSDAEYYLKRALSLDPTSADVTTSLGYLCIRKGDVERAQEAFEAALRIEPGHVRALDGKLHLRILSGQS
ncbi:MAG: tetratricopeptide repeat protein [Bacteroidetes bacterium]|nr:tetratricopeptide repeat protein [Bacteroidota bacterium]